MLNSATYRSGLRLASAAALLLAAFMLVAFARGETPAQAAPTTCDITWLVGVVNTGGTYNVDCGPNPAPINITGTQTISKNLSLTIIGTGKLTLDGLDTRRIFTVNSGKSLALGNIDLTHASSASGGAINNSGILTITNGNI